MLSLSVSALERLHFEHMGEVRSLWRETGEWPSLRFFFQLKFWVDARDENLIPPSTTNPQFWGSE